MRWTKNENNNTQATVYSQQNMQRQNIDPWGNASKVASFCIVSLASLSLIQSICNIFQICREHRLSVANCLQYFIPKTMSLFDSTRLVSSDRAIPCNEPLDVPKCLVGRHIFWWRTIRIYIVAVAALRRESTGTRDDQTDMHTQLRADVGRWQI